MNKKRVILSIMSIIIAILLMVMPNEVKASTALTSPLYFGVQEFRSGTVPENMGYAIKNPDENGSTTDSIVGAKIWQIVKYNNKSGGNYTTGNYYCVRAGVGFRNITDIAEYTISYDLKTEKKALEDSGNEYLRKIATNGYYNNLLALTDLLYLHGISTQSEKTALLQAAGISPDEYENPLTDSDIEAVQQAAIWYFTNHDEEGVFSRVYDNYDTDFVNGGDLTKTSWLFYKTSDMEKRGEKYTSFSKYDFNQSELGQYGAGLDRQEQAVLLYNYLIYTANNNAGAYANGTAVPKTKVTLYANATEQNTQPLITIEKIPEKVKEFDMSLRKYITAVQGEIVTNTRVPNIDESTIKTQGTATYKHRKDSIVVKNGNLITYNLTVYNEGEKAGRVTKIIDQLPEGLEFVRIVTPTSGFTANYNSSTRQVLITRDSSNTTNLDAYKQGDLKSETITIECRVTATASTAGEKILTNVAWIAEEYDAVDNVYITNQEGKDKDSTPSVIPNISNLPSYTGNNNKADLADSNYYYKGQEDDDDFEKVKLEKENDGTYNIILVKQDANGVQLDSQATFKVNGQIKQVIGILEIAKDVKITQENLGTPDEYVIQETVAPDKYCKFNGIITIKVKKKNDNGTYKVDTIEYDVKDENGNSIKDSDKDFSKVYLNEDGNIYVEVKNYQFDLKLLKKIDEVNGSKVPERIESVDITNLANGTETTATYKLNKNPVAVKKGDIVKYTFRIYNEGNIDGYASEITEDIPEGLEFIWSEKNDSELDSDTTLSQQEKDAIKYNQTRWNIDTVNSTTNKVELISTDYLAKGNGADIRDTGANLIKAFDASKEYKNTINDKNPDYKEISVYLKVVAEDATKITIRNEAAITDDTDADGNPVDDRDSSTDKWGKEDSDKYYDEDEKWPVYKEDDEDYDNLILQSFDLALRKFIIAVSKDDKIEDSEYLMNSDKTYTRAPIVDTSKLNTIGEDGKIITTAIYNHTKEPVEVTKNDYVVYMIRVYNEGDINGYASEIKDHLPPYLEFVNNDFNKKTYGWSVSEDGRTVTTSYLDNHLINKISTNDNGEIVLSYKEVPIMCRVTDNAEGKITNIADITANKDESKNPINDRDSKPNNVVLPSDKDLPTYKDDITDDYVPGQQDDDDFDKVIVKEFDLALRKFITGVNSEEVTSRIPQIKYDKENNQITYEHTKEPVDVVTSDIVIYTIRVFNEGEIDGFASRVTDDIPDGLKYLPENDLNKEYRWIMYDKDGKETEDVAKAVKITTDYLSKEQGEERMKKDESIKENPALLTAFDKDKEISDSNPDYADVKVAFEVIEPNGSDRIIINSAQISDDTDKDGNPVDDKDSTPDKWIEGEDDQDKEYIKLNYFDLALRKWVTHAIVIENGKETVTQTGHKAEDDPEQVVKVELNRKKLNSLQVKFKYSIRVTNEGDIAGYAKEITDYVPAGLKFVAADNPDWTDKGNNVIATRKLENTLLKPGESAEVQVTLTWINGKDNMGLKVNIAEISEDYNDKDVPDRDSTPNNRVPEEDDQDDAPVLISVSTGGAKLYFTLGFAILITIASGIVLIKKFVL